jgi:hypothetical protein
MNRVKPKWTAKSKKQQSIRMKEYWASKNKVAKKVVSTNKLSIKERLNIIEHHSKAIKQQLGLEIK